MLNIEHPTSYYDSANYNINECALPSCVPKCNIGWSVMFIYIVSNISFNYMMMRGCRDTLRELSGARPIPTRNIYVLEERNI